MKVIDLLVRIANGDKDLKDKNEIMINTYLHTHYVPDCLNDEVEVLEEDKKIEKLEILPDNEHYSNAVLYGKIDEIIDKINKE